MSDKPTPADLVLSMETKLELLRRGFEQGIAKTDLREIMTSIASDLDSIYALLGDV